VISARMVAGCVCTCRCDGKGTVYVRTVQNDKGPIDYGISPVGNDISCAIHKRSHAFRRFVADQPIPSFGFDASPYRLTELALTLWTSEA
jgi:hypothetical protein